MKDVKNKYKIPKAMWKKWNIEQHRMYNYIMDCYYEITNAPRKVFRPIDRAIKEHEKSIIHNCAFLAAGKVKSLK